MKENRCSSSVSSVSFLKLKSYVAFALAKKYYFHATFRAHEKKRERKTNNNKKKTEAHNLLSKVSFFKEK